MVSNLNAALCSVPAWPAEAGPAEAVRAQPGGELVGALALFAIVGIILAVVVLVAAYVMVRTARRARSLAGEVHKPTPYQDVWAMHQPPDIDVLEDEDEDPWGLNRPPT
jgi:heme/copper-type cytochrome/quinol oxidase subunit 2